ncbi:DUF6884 domain-containing protein [Arthrobacter globiformis]|uniref:DUF6884 domain-containing protein n=1 Tax=Arthrobacter globiformis TaxID=1665 RepID=UPI00278CA787|nr:DUF6884 domain-containing protein [Arthrobacter globiformis]MDQ0619218.1 hypothetical protein [Arthrobacter globiformis]
MSGEPCTIGLVACASQKLQRPAPARELYVSQWFKKASAYAELTCDRWYILSAKHGLIYPDQELAGSQDITLIALAGRQYRAALEGSPWPCEVPMQGLGLGTQHGWLTAKLAADRG